MREHVARYPRVVSKRRPYANGFLPNVDRRQVVLGAVVMVLVPFGGIAWGIVSVQRQSGPEQNAASAGLAVGVLFGALAGCAYALVERVRRGSFFIDDPVEIERNRSLGGLSLSYALGLSYAGIGVLLAAVLRFVPTRMEFLLGGALIGLMASWAPIAAAAAVRLLRRDRSDAVGRHKDA